MKSRNHGLMGLFIICIWYTCYGKTPISGDISNVSFAFTNSPFVVEKDINVPLGKEVHISQGCVLLFNEFTGLKVSGKLVVQGIATSPVVFTSVADSMFNKDSDSSGIPFGWNGIDIDNGATAIFNNIRINYSTYGIQSRSYELCIIQAIFSHNGQFNFTIDGNILRDNIPIENVPYNYKESKCTFDSSGSIVKIISEPIGAEVFINRKIELCHWPNGHTPISIRIENSHEMRLRLFKLGYVDTMLVFEPRTSYPDEILCKLSAADNTRLEQQHAFLLKRNIFRGVHIFALSGAVASGIAGSVRYHQAQSDFADADEAIKFLEGALIQSGPEWDAAVNKNITMTDVGNTKRKQAWACWGACCVATILSAVGFVLYF